MIRSLSWSLLSALLLALSSGSVIAKNEADSDGAVDTVELNRLAAELSHPKFLVREAATEKLWGIGEAARPFLQDAVDGSNPEAARRAKEVLHKLNLFIKPDTNPELVELIEAYQTASADQRKSLFQKIRALRAWPQLLRLYAQETDPYIRKTYASSMYSIALESARGEIWRGNEVQALELLKLAPQDFKGMNARASFHAAMGQLQAERKKVRELPGKKGAAWRLALSRAGGDLQQAVREAELAGEPLVSAGMAALDGDPMPWLLTISELERNQSNDMLPLYAALAQTRWMGGDLDGLVLRELSGKLVSSSIRQKGLAMNTLFLLNQTELAESYFEKSSPVNAFRHYMAQERIDDGFRVLGVDPDVSKNQKWLDKRIRSLTSNNVDDGYAQSALSEELIAYASFLDGRGLADPAYELFLPEMLKLGKKNQGALVAVLADLFSNIGGAPSLAYPIAKAWAGNQEDRWNDLRSEIFQSGDLADGWWKWLGELNPKASFAERMKGLLAMHRIGPDPDKLRDSYLDETWKAHEQADEREGAEILKLIGAIESQAGSVKMSLKAWDAQKEEDASEVFWGRRVVHLSAVSRWDEAADTILLEMHKMRDQGKFSSSELHAYAASALRNAGRTKEAAEQDKWADKMALGQSDVMSRIANGYAYGGDYKKASEWWARAAIFSDPRDDSFASYSRFHGESLIHNGDWKRAASVMEVLTAIHAESSYRMQFPITYTQQRLKADTCRALSQLADDKEGAIALLKECHQVHKADGALADFFFPALRKEGLTQYHDEWFEVTWNYFEKVIKRYPKSHNTRNTLAWFGSRAQRKLSESKQHLRAAMNGFPYQPAYMDTMAEIYFASGDRDKALKWSNLAIYYDPSESELRRQHHHFLFDPMPK